MTQGPRGGAPKKETFKKYEIIMTHGPKDRRNPDVPCGHGHLRYHEDHRPQFLMEMGKGFAFVDRQKHIHTEKNDYYIDLVFYNYLLKCFVLIDLKTTKVDYQGTGQMKMYVSMYDEKYRTEGDNPAIGILLCADTGEDVARYSSLHDDDQLYMAKYLTYMPTQDELVERIFFTTAELWGSAVRRFMMVCDIKDGKVEEPYFGSGFRCGVEEAGRIADTTYEIRWA